MQIIRDTNVGGRLGEAFGTGLQNLANMKLQELSSKYQQQQTAKGLQAIPGLNLTPEVAQQLAALPSEILQPILKEQLQAPYNQAFAEGLSQILGGGAPQEKLTEFPSEEEMQPTAAEGISSEAKIQPEALRKLKPQQAMQLADLQFKKRKQELAEEKEQSRKLERLEPQIKEWRQAAQEADVARSDIKLLKDLNARGELFSGKGRIAAERFGLAEYLQNPATEAAQKLFQQRLFKAMGKVVTPGKLTDAIIKSVQKSSASLLNSKEAIDILLDFLDLEAKADKLSYKEYLKQLDEGKVTRDLPDRIYKNTRKKFQSISEQKLKKLNDFLTPKELNEIYVGQAATNLPEGAKAYKGNKAQFVVKDGKWQSL